MKLSALIAPLIDAKAPHEQIMAVVLAFEAENVSALEQRRRADAERQARKRERDTMSRDITLRHSDRSLTGERVTRVEDITSNLEIEPQKKERTERDAQEREFVSFWTEYPNKVGKPKALASFVSARKRASLEAIMAGLRRYVTSKPADRAWMNPTTFLNQDRWDDSPANVVPMARGSPKDEMNHLIDSLVTQMDHADANPTTQTQGYPAAPLRLSAYAGGPSPTVAQLPDGSRGLAGRYR